MSLLGRLLSGAGPTTSTPRNPLDSNLEDQFTHNLLFPDPEALCHNDQVFPMSSGAILTPTAISNFDVNGDIDLDMRDVRVIIMQEATNLTGSAYQLYDSHPPPKPAAPSLERQASDNGAYPSRAGGRRSISSPRKASIGQNSRPVIIQQEPTAPRAFGGGAFDRRPHHKQTPSYNETEEQRSAREYREELTIFASCIFGNSEVLAYKGTGTKVHILPSESRIPLTSQSYMGDGSFGRSSMRSSKLAQSFTSDTVHGPTSAGFSPSTTTRGQDRKKVLITRMFPVPLPNDDTEDAAQNITPTPQNVNAGDTVGYPFPKVGDNASKIEKKKSEPKLLQKRTPMYAVGLVIHLPPTPHTPLPPASRSSARGPGSFTEQESYPSSYNSSRRSGWTMLGHGFGVESMDSSFSSDLDDRIDSITQHWDIIMRTLSHLQAVATATLFPMLKQADISSPDPTRGPMHVRAPSASVSISGKRVMEDYKAVKPAKTNTKVVQLNLHCLMPIPKIHKEVDAARQRIVSGMKANQVITGQGRWGIWREEARLVGKWAGGKDEGFFFFNLLTGFLGNHTEWLQALGPSWYRRRHYQQQRANKDDDISLPARTIIVSDNKLMARRLIFLLSAFLPTNQQLPSTRLHRPSTSMSFGGYSQSPPNYAVPMLREESLRRRLNRRTPILKATHSRTMSFPSQPMQESPHLGPEIHHDRRTSDAASIKTANLPIPGSDIGSRKSSAAITSAVIPVTTMPHFSTRRPHRGTGPAPRPGSSGSLATDDLLRSLKRGDSTGHYSTTSNESQCQNSRWGSMISGFWNSKRRDSTTSTSVEPLSVEGLEINDPHYKGPGSPQKSNKLARMVEEAKESQVIKTKDQQDCEMRKSESGSASTAKPEEEQGDEIPEQIVQTTERIPDPTGAFESPVKTSINEDDGVIDIDVPLPDYLSFETAVSSPSSSGYLSTPGFGNGMEGFEHYSRAGPDVDTTTNVGGWLPHFHPDFVLQAIPVQSDLLEEVKASMRAEPTPILTPTPQPDRGERWVDISSAVIADTTNFSIKRIRYMRLVKPADHASTSAPHTVDTRYGNVYTAAQLTPSVEVYECHIEEKFIEEAIISMDETLIEAVERIIAQSGQGSKTSSVCSSRSTSRKGGNRERSNSDIKFPLVPEHKLEVPRNECKKMVLSALEDIAREVAESRNEQGDGEAQIERESFLREGVRNWLSSVETAE